jgi:hypothetical protein
MASTLIPIYTSTKEASQAASKNSRNFQRSFSNFLQTISNEEASQKGSTRLY